jgi:phosphate starvation-inducible PhoH-like protein
MHLDRDHLFFGLGPKLTDEQYEYIDLIFNRIITISNSGAGCGKTSTAVAAAKYLIDDKKTNYQKLIYVFSPVNEDRQGFLPGNQQMKDLMYLKPLKNSLIKIGFQPDHINKQGGWVEAYSHTYERGDDIEDAIVIIDEAQNWKLDELCKMLTRLHDNCKCIMIGHSGQIDLADKSLSGFIPYIEHFKKAPKEKVGFANLTLDFRGWLSRYSDSIKKV